MEDKIYPLKFDSLYKLKVWGGRSLEKYRYNLPKGLIGESWDIACNQNGISSISNGWMKGMTFKEVVKRYPKEILGMKYISNEFPLLIKIITSNNKLSIQVHPDDNYAKIHENCKGKKEMWYILDAQKGASIVIGTTITSKEKLKKELENNHIENYLNEIEVHKGEIYYIPCGLIHGIGQGCTILEIQQNSDVTYRIYDYNRDRELHIKKALDVIDVSKRGYRIRANNLSSENLAIKRYSSIDFIDLEQIELYESVEIINDGNQFEILSVTDGMCEIIYNAGSVNIMAGQSVLIPAALKKYILKGNANILKINNKD